MGRNEFKLNIAGFSRSLELKIKEEECKIPSLLLVSRACIENCIWTSEDTEITKTVDKKKDGFIHPWVIKSLKLFLKTPEGQEVFGLFLNEGDSIVLDNEKVFTATCRGDFYDIHALHFIEMSDMKGGALASTITQFHQRCPRKIKAYKWHAERSVRTFWIVSNKERIKNSPKDFYLKVIIKVYIRNYIEAAKEEKWDEERVIAQMCHSMGHEFFIHAWKKAIPAMKAWCNNDLDSCFDIFQRDTGYKGKHDHAAYAQDIGDEGLRKMKSFQESLRGLIGDKLYRSVVTDHDKKYKALKNVVIPKGSQINTEY
ncbi:hypothetical protein HN014_04240 [Aquimarina sp. TRL1]|uniref:hypothetical protein n=1 Tax=Aquimarina sp. (strain TRL1) TaxID=2736252 RepID=UPI0015894F47|nr:hypothetical protein [Aquimarina sp. TRL1]QKX04148.1 hypothetical protein HN014_04240 [Aquimarina sp. TRL1]